jgi:hypothetical protein
MSAEKAVIQMLLANTALAALVDENVDAAVVEQSTERPALGVSHISTVSAGHLNVKAAAAEALVSRVQVTCFAETYPQLQQLLDTGRAACGNRSGTFNGVTVRSTRIDLVGPDMKSDDDQVFIRSFDVRVMWIRALP